MSAAKPARKPKTIEPPRPIAVPDPKPSRAKLLEESRPPLLTLDEIVVMGKHGEKSERLVITGEELAHVLSLREQHTNTYAMCDAGDTHLMLRGLSELLQGHEDTNELGGDGAYFLSRTLEGLAIRLEADSRVDQFNVFLRKKGADAKAVAS
jgi:hypothetical protein